MRMKADYKLISYNCRIWKSANNARNRTQAQFKYIQENMSRTLSWNDIFGHQN